MAHYIVCHKKRNAPRLDVRVCQQKCPLKNECQSYLAYVKPPVDKEEIPLGKDSPAEIIASA
jgi:hypothetical protein